MAEPVGVPDLVRELAEKLGVPVPMRRGSVSVRHVKCGKEGCPCAERADARHGPYASVVRVVGGKTQSQRVPGEKLDMLRQQVEAGHAFRRQLEAYWDACEVWANAQLEIVQAASQEAAKKGGSKRRSQRRSSPKSKRL